ncbi:MAG: AMP-binding protein [Pseudomonadota bacterium]
MFWQTRTPSEDGKNFLTEDSTTLTYGQAFDQADLLYAGTIRGVALILCDRNIDTVLAYIGALRAGHVPLLIDAETKPGALSRILSEYRPDYLFAPASFEPSEGWHAHTRTGTSQLWAAANREDTPLHQNLCLLLPTSGSTGDPKTVRLTAANVQSCTEEICRYLSMTPDVRAAALLPLHYSYGLSVLHSVMEARATFVLTQKSVLDRDFWAFVEEANITDIAGVPFIFEIMRRMKIPDAVMANLRCVTQAGGRLDPRITKQFVTLFASADVQYFTMYGQTEAAPRIAYLPPEMAEEKLGAVGRPLSIGTACIAETGAPTGEGELLYSGPNVCMGYAQNRADLAKGDELMGRLHTGDHVCIDDDGIIHIIGRRARFVKLQGQSVSLDHVESILKAQDIDCRAIGRDNLLVICHTGEAEARIAETLKENFTVHSSSVKIKAVEELSLNSSGKPDYTALEERFL